jgi:hypothetical protein
VAARAVWGLQLIRKNQGMAPTLIFPVSALIATGQPKWLATSSNSGLTALPFLWDPITGLSYMFYVHVRLLMTQEVEHGG